MCKCELVKLIKVHQHALINQMLYKKTNKQKNNLRPNDVLVRPTEKVSRTSATSGKNESRALSWVENISPGDRVLLRSVEDEERNTFKGFPFEMKIDGKRNPQAIKNVDEFVTSSDLEKFSSSVDPLQWMGAVRMRVQTADKNITIIHTTPVHQLTSWEDKSWN